MVPSVRERPIFGIWSLLWAGEVTPRSRGQGVVEPGMEQKLPSGHGYQEQGCSYPK